MLLFTHQTIIMTILSDSDAELKPKQLEIIGDSCEFASPQVSVNHVIQALKATNLSQPFEQSSIRGYGGVDESIQPLDGNIENPDKLYDYFSLHGLTEKQAQKKLRGDPAFLLPAFATPHQTLDHLVAKCTEISPTEFWNDITITEALEFLKTHQITTGQIFRYQCPCCIKDPSKATPHHTLTEHSIGFSEDQSTWIVKKSTAGIPSEWQKQSNASCISAKSIGTIFNANTDNEFKLGELIDLGLIPSGLVTYYLLALEAQKLESLTIRRYTNMSEQSFVQFVSQISTLFEDKLKINITAPTHAWQITNDAKSSFDSKKFIQILDQHTGVRDEFQHWLNSWDRFIDPSTKTSDLVEPTLILSEYEDSNTTFWVQNNKTVMAAPTANFYLQKPVATIKGGYINPLLIINSKGEIVLKDGY
jgi:hypothetical protein